MSLAQDLFKAKSISEYRVASREDLKESLEAQSREFKAHLESSLKLISAEFEKKIVTMTITTVVILGSLLGLISYLQ